MAELKGLRRAEMAFKKSPDYGLLARGYALLLFPICLTFRPCFGAVPDPSVHELVSLSIAFVSAFDSPTRPG